jgi:hypothetical protein
MPVSKKAIFTGFPKLCRTSVTAATSFRADSSVKDALSVKCLACTVGQQVTYTDVTDVFRQEPVLSPTIYSDVSLIVQRLVSQHQITSEGKDYDIRYGE